MAGFFSFLRSYIQYSELGETIVQVYLVDYKRDAMLGDLTKLFAGISSDLIFRRSHGN